MKQVTAYKTQDGKIFETEAAARDHEYGQMLSEKLDAFSLLDECPYKDGVANQQMRKSIAAWELHKSKACYQDSITTLELTVRSENCLRSAGVKTIGDLVALRFSDLLKIDNLGRKSAYEIQDALVLRGHSLLEGGAI